MVLLSLGLDFSPICLCMSMQKLLYLFKASYVIPTWQTLKFVDGRDGLSTFYHFYILNFTKQLTKKQNCVPVLRICTYTRKVFMKSNSSHTLSSWIIFSHSSVNWPLPRTADDLTSCKAYLFAHIVDVSVFLLQA